jgi:hypothetical protein
MKRAWLLALALVGCRADPDIALDIRLPDDRRLLAAVTRLDVRAERGGRVLAERSFGSDVGYVSLSGVPHGSDTVISLEGRDPSGAVLATGRTCPFAYDRPGVTASIYFAPANFFGPTAAAPVALRDDPLAITLDDFSVLVAGGLDLTSDAALASAEHYSPSTGLFAPMQAALNVGREDAQVQPIAEVGALVVGGRGRDGAPIKTAEVYVRSSGTFVPFDNDILGPRIGHRMCVLPDERALVTGGITVAGGAPLSSTALVRLQPDGSASVVAGPALNRARAAHAIVVAVGVAVVVGGYGSDGKPLTSLEALTLDERGAPLQWSAVAELQEARAEATATLLGDGSILIVGGSGDAARTPRGDAEVYNPITRTTTIFPLGSARRRHSATLLADGRVLVIGGVGADGKPLDSVELFVPGIGFVSERPLRVARASHVAVPLCDGTVLVLGGGDGAELYTPAAPPAG